MKEFRFLHCADFHLDTPFVVLGGDSEKAEIRRRDIQDTFKSVLELAERESCEAILICGDLFEHSHLKKATTDVIFNMMETYSHISIVIISGNHDPMVEGSPYKTLSWPSNVIFLTHQNPKIILGNACIWGNGFQDFYQDKIIIEGIECADTSFINIMMTHGTIEGAESGKNYNPLKIKEIETLGMDYVALGHFHNRIENVGKNGLVFNPGSPEPLGFDEEGIHGVFIAEIYKDENKVTREVQFVATQKRRYWNIEIDATGIISFLELKEKFNELTGAEDRKNYLISLLIKGYLDKNVETQLSNWFEELEKETFLFKADLKTESLPDFAEISTENSIQGVFARKISERFAKSVDHEDRVRLLRAYRFGMEALERGKVEV